MADIVIPGEETRLSLNRDAGREGPPKLIVIHASRGHGATLELEYQGLVNFCLRPNDNSNSCPHYAVGPTRVCRMIHDSDRAWHARYLNGRSLGIEVAQPASLPEFTETEYNLTARIVAAWCHAFGIPPMHVRDENLRGYIGHDETAQGRSEGKSDPGSRWDWHSFDARVAFLYADQPPPPTFDPWAGIGTGLAAVGKAHPEWGTPNTRALAAHYFDADHDEVVKLTSGDWLIWRHYTDRWIRAPFSEQH